MTIDFSEVLEDFKKNVSLRDDVSNECREVIRESKKAIYSVHRGDLDIASNSISLMEDKLKKIKENFNDSSIVKVAFQEFVEAVCFYDFIKDRTVPSAKKLNVSSEEYLAGVCDFSGELVRKGINSVLEGNYKDLMDVKRVLDEIYGELLKFDFRNGDLRRKFDKVKYDLMKIEEVCLDLKKSGGCCKSG